MILLAIHGALPSVPVQCGVNHLAADFWLVAKLIIIIVLAGFPVITWFKSKGNLMPTLGALLVSALLFWGSILGGVFAIGGSLGDTLTSAGFNSAPTDFGAPTGC